MPTALVAARPQHKATASASSQSLQAATLTSTEPLSMRLKVLHQKASRALILGQGNVAWMHCREAIQHCNIETLTCEYGEQQARQLCCRLWILYICVLSSLAEIAAEDGKLRPKDGLVQPAAAAAAAAKDSQLAGFPVSVREVWSSIMTAFGGYAGNVDSEVLVPIVLLCLKLRDAKTARDIVEAWLATLSDETMFLLQGSDDGYAGELNGSARKQQRTMVQASYMRVCELYTLHILPQLGDFESAYDFLSMSSVVTAPAKEEYTKRLDSLRSPATSKKPRPTAAHRSKKKTTKRVAIIKTAQTANGKLDANADTKVNADTDAGASAKAQDTSPVRAYIPRTPLPAPSAAAAVARSTGVATRQSAKPRALTRRPRSAMSIAWQVVRRVMSRWGLTVFTLAVAIAVLRLVAQRFRLPPLLNAITRRLWSTFKMGTQVTYI
ncbi:hypothetical protein LPJ64_000847 [Coemansia asiatica]|uniref:Uncharacterized protein n=1 Tax=Coemansia asiatica TaxID=1052880 RepID=A0A9W8CKJ2_9FUNG|nr:hypothetical protein LPJ64_000847 [Coemansia asiatica]